MHQSIPAVPIPPGQPRGICSNVSPGGGALAILSQPGGGALAILSQPGGWALAYPRGDPRAFDTRVFELTWKNLSERTRT